MSHPSARSVLILTLLPSALATCARPTPTPVAPPAAVAETQPLVFGTAPEYRPFEFYNDARQLDGFDVALAQALGEHLGRPVSLKDVPFDGLAQALALGEIDAAISAISVTPERAAQVDFTDIYYLGEDAVLGATGASRESLKELLDLATLRVGVQRASVYEQIVQTELVDSGKMPAANLVAYETTDAAVAALKAGEIEAVLLDNLPAQDYAQAGGVVVVAVGLHPQDFAIAVPKAGAALRDALNGALAALKTDGTLAALYQRYLLPPPGDLPTSPPPGTPVAVATTAPCLNGMTLDSDLTLDDQGNTAPDAVAPGAPFVKAWRVVNSGTCAWDSGYALVFADGERMGGEAVPITGTVPAGAAWTLQLPLVAPDPPGTYQGFWNLVDAAGAAFGQRLDVLVQVTGEPPTPAPSATPAEGITFTATPTEITAGEEVTFAWHVTGSQAQYFYRQGESWAQYPVGPASQRVAWPNQSATYELRVILNDGTTELRQITIQVQPAPAAPAITRFTLNPAGQLMVGACTTASWIVDGAVDTVRLFRGDQLLYEGPQPKGQSRDCPTAPGVATYRLEATGPYGTSRASRDLTVVTGAPTATPVPAGATPGTAPQIVRFGVSPTRVQAGQCVTIYWEVQGATQVRIRRNTSTVLDYAPLAGNTYDCPITAGSVAYRVEAVNAAGQSAVDDEVISVSGP